MSLWKPLKCWQKNDILPKIFYAEVSTLYCCMSPSQANVSLFISMNQMTFWYFNGVDKQNIANYSRHEQFTYETQEALSQRSCSWNFVFTKRYSYINQSNLCNFSFKYWYTFITFPNLIPRGGKTSDQFIYLWKII